MTKEQADALLNGYLHFDEAVLLGICSSNLMRDYWVLVSPARDQTGNLRADLEAVVLARFLNCESVEIRNFFWPELLGDEANWGLNEVALIHTSQCDNGHLLFRFSWESERFIEIECEAISIVTERDQISTLTDQWLDNAIAPIRAS